MSSVKVVAIGAIAILFVSLSLVAAQERGGRDGETTKVQPGQGDTRASLGEAARDVAKAVFLVGNDKGGHGTAWVLSRKHRLLVTNAHVADIMHPSGKMKAILNGTTTVFEANKVWYHPGVRRYLSGLCSVRATDPREGKVDPNCPDVAVIQLADGPELPAELTMASPEELKDLWAKPAAIAGYPGHDTVGAKGKAQATYHEGAISRLTDYQLGTDVPERELQFLQYTMSTFGGFSGSPIFLANGHVVAVHNSARKVQDKVLAHGVRIDAVWELLVHHGLQGKVSAAIDAAKLDVQRWIAPDERDEKARKALQLAKEASRLVYVDLDYDGGIAKATEAIALAPTLARAYRLRQGAYMSKSAHLTASREQRAGWLNQAKDNAAMALKYSQPDDTDALFGLGYVYISLSHFNQDKALAREAVKLMETVLAVPDLTPYNQARAFCVLGRSFDLLGDAKRSLEFHNKAVGLFPDEPTLWEERAALWESSASDYKDAKGLAQSDKARAKLLREHVYGKGLTWEQISAVTEQLTAKDGLGRVRPNAYYQVYTIDLKQGVLYRIELSSAAMDPYLRIEDEKGKVLAEDDDSGGNLNSMIFFRPAASGTYRLLVSTFEARQTGNFSLTVKAGR